MAKKVEQVDTFPPKEDTIETGYVDDQIKAALCDMFQIRSAEGTVLYESCDAMTDQTIKADAGKPQVRLVPPEAIFAVAKIREYGNNKYGDSDSWKQVAVERYRDAFYRHLLLYLRDPHGVDSESGLPHLWHAMCNGFFLCAKEEPYFREKGLVNWDE